MDVQQAELVFVTILDIGNKMTALHAHQKNNMIMNFYSINLVVSHSAASE